MALRVVIGVFLGPALALSPAFADAAPSSLAPAPGAPAARFPDEIFIKTPARTFNAFFYFALDEQGRIWIKPIRKQKETEGFAPGWQLFGTGLPSNPKKPGFAVPRRIKAIHGDADEIMAVSDENRHYSMRWLPNPVFAGTPREWTDVHGWPLEEPYVWKDRALGNLGWGIGRRNQIVKFFEDIDGKSFDGGGGLTTYYFLSQDGTEIYFSDSGLPADFSHTMCGPNRGTFKAVAFDVSASTMFIMDRFGRMYTRMSDFDTNGSDQMFFEYTYDRRNKAKNLISIPAEEWLDHEPIHLKGKARITSQITIALTGPNNRGRELRVAGYDKLGRPGYYHKPIFVQELGSPERKRVDVWEFEHVEQLAWDIDPKRELKPEETDPLRYPVLADGKRWSPPAEEAPRRDVRLKGELRANGKRLGVEVELADFSLQCTPTRLVLSSGGESFEATLHTVEEWYHLKRVDPGRDGTPKQLVGTLELGDKVAQVRDPGLKKVIEQYLKPYDLVDFAFWIDATEDYLALEARRAPIGEAKISMSFTRAGRGYPSIAVARRSAHHQERFTMFADSDAFRIEKPLRELRPDDAPRLEELYRANQRLLAKMRRDFAAPERDDAETPFFITGGGLVGMKIGSQLLFGANLWAPYWKTLSWNLPPLVDRNQEYKSQVRLISQQDLDTAIEIVHNRLIAYRRRLDELKGLVAETPWIHRETASEYWKDLGLSFGTVAGSAFEAGDVPLVPGCRIELNDAGMLDPARRAILGRREGPAGILLSVACGEEQADESLILRVVPSHLARDAYVASLAGGSPGEAGKPLSTDVRVHLEFTNGSALAESIVFRLLGGSPQDVPIEASGTLRIENGRYRLQLGRGARCDWSR